VIEENTAHRLRTVRGHVDALIRMVDSGRSCVDVLHQLSAVRGSLEAVQRQVLACHLEECLEALVAGESPDHLVEQVMAAAFGGPVTSRRRDPLS